VTRVYYQNKDLIGSMFSILIGVIFGVYLRSSDEMIGSSDLDVIIGILGVVLVCGFIAIILMEFEHWYRLKTLKPRDQMIFGDVILVYIRYADIMDFQHVDETEFTGLRIKVSDFDYQKVIPDFTTLNKKL